MLKAYALDIVRGVSATQFAPHNRITRQEMCVMIFQALKAAGKDVTLPPLSAFPFTDAALIADWAIAEEGCRRPRRIRLFRPGIAGGRGAGTRAVLRAPCSRASRDRQAPG